MITRLSSQGTKMADLKEIDTLRLDLEEKARECGTIKVLNTSLEQEVQELKDEVQELKNEVRELKEVLFSIVFKRPRINLLFSLEAGSHSKS